VHEETKIPQRPIHPDRLQKMMKSESAPILVDVREPGEFAEGHIPGAVSIPLGQLDVAAEQLDANRTIVTYCRSGVRGGAAARLLARRGFDANTLEGGFSAWPFETATGPGEALVAGDAVSSADLMAVATLREIQAMEFYSLASGRVSDTGIKEVLEYLAVMERGHMDAVYGRYKTLMADEGREAESLETLKSRATEPVEQWQIRDGQVDVVARSYDVDMSLEDPEDVSEILDRAVSWEFEAYDFYRRSSELIGDEALRSALVDMAFEERIHANMILKVMGTLGGK